MHTNQLQRFQWQHIGFLFLGVLLFLFSASVVHAADDTVPAAPTGITITNRTSTSIQVSWSPSESATGYIVEVFGRGGTHAGIIQNVTDTTLKIGKRILNSNKQYYLKIKALNDDIGGPWSDRVDFRTRPSAVRDFQLLDYNNTEAVLGWKKPRGDLDYYLVQVKRKGIVRRTITVNAMDTIEQVTTVTGLVPTRAYRFRVRAVYDNGNKSEYTDSIKLLKRVTP